MSAHHHATPVAAPAPTDPSQAPAKSYSDWSVIRSLVPYLWDFRWRVALDLAFLVTAKLANIDLKKQK